MTNQVRYKRVLIKLGGELLSGIDNRGYSAHSLDFIVDELITARQLGVELAVVVGGGNLFRGGQANHLLDRRAADPIGMLATVMNALMLQETCRKKGLLAQAYSAVAIDKFVKFYRQHDAESAIAEGNVVFFCAGTGNPLFTTDTAASLRAIEMNAEVLLKLTTVDGVYSSDPRIDPTAKKYSTIHYNQMLLDELKVMDAAAIHLCKEFRMPVLVTTLDRKGKLPDILCGISTGTCITAEE